MIKTSLGLPSTIQDSTYHQNRDNEATQLRSELQEQRDREKILKSENLKLNLKLISELKNRLKEA